MALVELKNYVLGATDCGHRPAVAQTVSRHFTRLGHTYRDSQAVTIGIDSFIRNLSRKELTIWTQQVHKQGTDSKGLACRTCCVLSEPVTNVTNEIKTMPHLSILSPDADLIAALIHRNEYLEARIQFLEASCRATNEAVVRLPAQDVHHYGADVPMMNRSDLPVVHLVERETSLMDWDGGRIDLGSIDLTDFLCDN